MPDLKLHVAEHFEVPVWRMEIDSVTGLLFTELREVSRREVSFAAINLTSGQTCYKDFKTDEKWLTGMEAAYNGVLLLHYYEKQNSPAHKGLAAFNGTDHRMLWNNFNYGFDQLSINGPVLHDLRFQPRKLFVVDMQTGARKHPFDAINDVPPGNFIDQPQPVPLTSVPELEPLQLVAFGNIALSLRYNTFRIVSLHTQWAGQLKQLLYIFKGHELVYEDLLNADIQKMQPEAFIRYKNQLIYLKDRTELKVLNLEG